MEKRAIVLAAYGGASVHTTRSLGYFEARIKTLFPEVPVRRAFTSSFMRNRMTASGKKNDSVKKALCRLGYENFTHVAVQSLHVVPGFEFNSLLEEIAEAREAGAPSLLTVGGPLLYTAGDIDLGAAALQSCVPQERKPDEAVLWVGHGSDQADCVAYAQLAEAVKCLDPLILVGTLSGERDFSAMLHEMMQWNVRKVWLLPLLAVLGKHAEQDLAGASPDSWKSRFTAVGITCEVKLRGVIERSPFVDIWLRHLLVSAPWLNFPCVVSE